MPKYDPLLTMSALNMAIVSLHRITSTRDRLILDQEYTNIINNIRMGEINADPELTELYQEIVRVIHNGRLRDDERRRIDDDYSAQKQKGIKEIIAGNVFTSFSTSPLKWLGKLAMSCMSEYFSSKIRGEINYTGKTLQLETKELKDYDALQRKLLGSSWTLLRQYGLSDSYRLTQNGLDKFYAAMQESDPSKRNRMLKYIEGDFAMYSPYWFYRGYSAQEAGDIAETRKCFDRFNEVWRPTLRKDPYKVEALKFRIDELTREGITEDCAGEITACLSEMRENTPLEDWANNIYMGMMYFTLGMKDKAIELVMCNLDFEFEVKVSRKLLTKIKMNTPQKKFAVNEERVIQLPTSQVQIIQPEAPSTSAKPKRPDKKLLIEQARHGDS